MGDEHRQLALRRVRLEVICETIARLRARMVATPCPSQVLDGADLTKLPMERPAGQKATDEFSLAETLSQKLTAAAAAAGLVQQHYLRSNPDVRLHHAD